MTTDFSKVQYSYVSVEMGIIATKIYVKLILRDHDFFWIEAFVSWDFMMHYKGRLTSVF